jgi:predicted lipoprotein with Yx(FWY)xxD motif
MRKTSRFIFLFVLLFMAGIWACATAIQLKNKEGVGKYLTDANGMSLYYFKKDLDGQSTCIEDCINRWPVFYKEKILVPQGLNENDFSTILRTDGGKQIAYKGRPLYYWFQDKNPGDMNGEGINKAWYVIYPDTFKP